MVKILSALLAMSVSMPVMAWDFKSPNGTWQNAIPEMLRHFTPYAMPYMVEDDSPAPQDDDWQ